MAAYTSVRGGQLRELLPAVLKVAMMLRRTQGGAPAFVSSQLPLLLYAVGGTWRYPVLFLRGIPDYSSRPCIVHLRLR